MKKVPASVDLLTSKLQIRSKYLNEFLNPSPPKEPAVKNGPYLGKKLS